MKFVQKTLVISPKPRGFHLITKDILVAIPEIKNISNGLLQIFIQHTSASLSINENADSTVRMDFENHMNVLVPENQPYYRHTYEGVDDMPAHIKASLMGSSLSVPVTKGRLNMGTWQGIYLCEHRNNGGSRSLVLTAFGEV
jgi:secondary thiamine-phosphate synthase enzyme